MNATVTLAVVGSFGPLAVLAPEAVEGLRDKIEGTDDPRVTVRLPDGSTDLLELVPETIRVTDLPGGQQALVCEVRDVPESVRLHLPELAPPASAADVTEDDRAAQMPELEQQAEEGERRRMFAEQDLDQP